jgi:hypothetical protein
LHSEDFDIVGEVASEHPIEHPEVAARMEGVLPSSVPESEKSSVPASDTSAPSGLESTPALVSESMIDVDDRASHHSSLPSGMVKRKHEFTVSVVPAAFREEAYIIYKKYAVSLMRIRVF